MESNAIPTPRTLALKAIARHGERLGLSVDAILEAGAGLLDGRFSAEEFVAEISEPAAAQMETTTKQPASPKPRANTKQALMIEMLRRPEGATVEQIAEATGWQNHSVRGAIAGALKKKLGLTITTERVRNVGPNKEGARGSYTIYRDRRRQRDRTRDLEAASA